MGWCGHKCVAAGARRRNRIVRGRAGNGGRRLAGSGGEVRE